MSRDVVSYSRSLLLGGNVVLGVWVFLAFLSAWWYNQTFGYLFGLFAAFSIYVVLRRLGCSSCANCKHCTLGFGKLAGAFFGTGNTKRVSVGTRTGIIAFTYFFMAPLPALLLSISLVEAFTLLKVVVMVCLLALSACSVLTWFLKPTNTQND